MAENLSQTLRVDVSQDMMQCSLSAGQRSDVGKSITLKQLRSRVKDEGVTHGISDEALKQFLKILQTSRDEIPPMVIATGTPATSGADGRADLNFHSTLTVGKCDDAGKVDYRDRGFINNTEADAVVATIVPPERGEPGTTVTGEELRGTRGHEAMRPAAGENVKMSDDRLTYISKVAGHVHLDQDCIMVDEEVHIQGDVDYKTGNIDFSGNLVISGSVTANFSVKCNGNVKIVKCVEPKAHVVAGGDIEVDGIIRCSKEEVFVHAEGNIRARAVENSYIRARGDITISGHATASKIKCLGCLRGEAAEIRGCEIEAVGGIEVARVVTDGSDGSRLVAGITLEDSTKLRDLEAQIKELNEARESVFATFVNRFGEFVRDRAALEQLSDEERAEFEAAKEGSAQRQDAIQDHVNELTKQANELVEEVLEQPDRVVAVSGEVGAGCAIGIRELSWRLRNQFGPVIFYEDTKGHTIRKTDYYEDALSRKPPVDEADGAATDNTPFGLARRLRECPDDDAEAISSAVSRGLSALKQKRYQTCGVFASVGLVICKAVKLQSKGDERARLANTAFGLLKESLKRDNVHAQSISTKGLLHDVLGELDKAYEQHKKAAEIIGKLAHKGRAVEIYERQARSLEAIAESASQGRLHEESKRFLEEAAIAYQLTLDSSPDDDSRVRCSEALDRVQGGKQPTSA